MLASVLSRAQSGIEAPQVTVEVHIDSGLPALTIVGLADGAVREARERVRAALKLAGFEFPTGRITVNLAPADLPKGGGRFDLPIAVGLLIASGQLPANSFAASEFYGELSLSGELKPIRGTLPAVCHATRARHSVIVPTSTTSRSLAVRSKSPPRAATTSFSSARRAPARACSPTDFPEFFPR